MIETKNILINKLFSELIYLCDFVFIKLIIKYSSG